MLHVYASEFVAGLTCLMLLAFALFLVLRPSTATAASRAWELLCYLTSAACMCRFLARGKQCHWPPGVSYKGRVAVVVGASSGIGYAVAEELAEHEWTVILAGRDMKRLLLARERLFYALEEKKAIQQQSAVLRAVLPWLPRCVRTRVMGYKRPIIRGFNVLVLATVDLSSEVSVRSFADTLRSAESSYPVSLLVNAAGVMHRHSRYCPSYTPWSGLETMIATNAVGPQLLTRLLLPLLEATAEKTGVTSRIVNIASSCHTWLVTSPAQLMPFLPTAGVSALPPNPIEMLYGLECKAPVVQKTAPAPPSSAAARPEKIRDAYKISDFSFSNFTGYYGLSKLCVVWNTLLMARLLSQPRYRFADTAKADEDTAAVAATTPAAGARRQGEYKIYIASCHPGVIVTGLYRELLPEWVLYKLLYYPSLVMGKTWREGAQSALKVAIETSSMTHGGYYLCGGEYGPESGVNCLSSHARDPEALKAYATFLAEKLGDDFGAAKPTHTGTTA